MENDEYAIACTEVLEVLNYVSREDYAKIPQKIIAVLEKNKKQDVVFLYNPWKSLNEQAMSKQGRLMIASFYKDYWANEEERKQINEKQNYARQKIEEEKREKYKYEDLFKNQTYKVETIENIEDNNLATAKESFFVKIFNKIKSFFNAK